MTFAEACSDGEFYSSVSNSCVTECPCGTYGDATSAMCRQGELIHAYMHACIIVHDCMHACTVA